MARVLVIDDDSAVRTLVEEALRHAGHDVVSFQEFPTPAAMRLVAKDLDLVITDMMMPDKDGFQVIAELRKDFPGMPIIAMSGATGGLALLPMASQLGAARTIRKPFSMRDLANLVEEVLRTWPN
jgi:DNA-binding response OmpR family regulator